MLNYIILLSILPITYKLLFWTYTIQLKEYRWDRFKEYLTTKQGKKAIFNFFLIPEIIVFLIAIGAFYNIIIKVVLIYFLLILLGFENLYVIYKIIKKKLISPKKTGRSIILLGLIVLDLIGTFVFFYVYENILYLFIPIILALFPWYVMLWNLIITPFINIKKRKLFKKAGKKSKKLNIHKIGITGSFGKTSTKEYISGLLESKYEVFKTPKNINSELGLANLVLHKKKWNYDFFVAEMGAYKKGEIHQAGEIINHKDAFLTGIGNQHVALFGNQQNIIDGKCQIGEKVLENNGKLYINDNIKIKDNKIFIDNNEYKLPDIIKKLLEKKMIVFYGLDNNQAFSKILKITEKGTEFEFNYKEKTYKLKTNLIGKAQIENLTGALAFAIDNKVEKLQKALDNIKQPEHTLNISKKDNITFIDDTYNLSVNGLLNGVDVISYFSGEKILVLDDILELGKNAEKIHYNIGKKIAQKFDKILFVGINYKESFIKGVKDGKGNIIDDLPDNIDKKTVILFEGKKAGKYIKYDYTENS